MSNGGSLLRIVSWGSFSDNSRFFCEKNHEKIPYPVGYTIERSVFINNTGKSRTDRTKVLFPDDVGDDTHVDNLYYTAIIKQGPDDDLLFEVTRSDRPDIVYSANNPSAPWRNALAAAERDFPSLTEKLVKERRDASGVMLLRGQKWFGLTYENVLAKLKKVFNFTSLDTINGSTHLSVEGKKKLNASRCSSTDVVSNVAEKRKNVQLPVIVDDSSQEKVLSPQTSTPVKKRHSSKKDNDTECRKVTIEKDDIPLSVLLAGKVSGGIKPCINCGLTTAYCPFTGKLHSSKGQNYQDSTVVERAKTTKLSRFAGEVKKQTNRVEKPLKKRGRSLTSGDELNDKGSRLVSGEDCKVAKKNLSRAPAPKKTQKVSKEKITNGGLKQQTLLCSSLPTRDNFVFQDGDDVPFVMRVAKNMVAASIATNTERKRKRKTTSPSSPATHVLNPPLTDAESQKAMKIFQHLIREEKIIFVPFASSLNIPLDSFAKTKTRKRKRYDSVDIEAPGVSADNIIEKCESAAATDAENGKTLDCAKENHPLDIVNITTSSICKRYMSFMQKYTSERAKLDLLKKADVLQTIKKSNGKLTKDIDKSNEASVFAPKKEEVEVA